MNEFMDASTARARGKEIAGALRSLASSTDRAFSMQTKPGRFRIQKTVYLLKALNYPPASRFDYSIYLNGPYSPELAQVYYALGEDGIRRAQLTVDVPARTINTIAAALAKGEEFLEGLTTVIDGLPREGNVTRALAWAQSIKPHLSDYIWREVRIFLAEHSDLTQRT